MTSGCTMESQGFRDAEPEFLKYGVKIFGVSKDPISSHEKFSKKESLQFPLLSDENVELITALGLWKEKSLYGRKYMGTERSTFLIKNGDIIQEWRKVKVKGHVEEVLSAVRQL